MTKTVKSILLKVKAKGQGIVNFDGGQQKKVTGHLFFNHNEIEGGIPNNVSYSKKVFSRDENGKLTYKILVSNECVGKEIFGAETPITAQDIVIDQRARLLFLTSKSAILRGYLFATKTFSLKRKSAVTLPDFIQSDNAQSSMVIGTTAGSRDSNSLFYRETVGEINYESNGGVINLKELSFASLDYRHDRESLLESDLKEATELYKENFNGFTPELKYYTQKGSKVFLPERGFVFSNEAVVDMVKFYLTNLLFASVKRKKAFLDVTEVQIKLVEDPFTDVYNDENGWITLDLNTIKGLDFNVFEFYESVDDEEAKAVLEPLDALKKVKKEKKAEEKKEKRDKAAAYKKEMEAKEVDSAKK